MRGIAAVGSNGFGFVTFAPYATGATDQVCGYYSGSGYAGVTINQDTVAGITALQNAQYPYTFANTRPYRVVASGLRVRYIGTELNRGGQCVVVRASNNFGANSTLIGADMADLLSRQRTVSLSVDRNWHGCNYLAVDNANSYITTSTYSLASEQLCVAFTGTAGNQFEFEIITYFEILPTIVSGVLRTVPTQTASHSDADGLSHIRNWMNSALDSVMGSNAFNLALRAISASMLGKYRQSTPTIEWNL
jgi:hypothetical protein